ncbi:hypothetical protein [Priestia flexa]|nr:hypothetical protein [Priestia flexa]
MTVKYLIEHLATLNQDSEVLISCEGGCVVDNEITVSQKDGKIILEI